MRCKLWRYGVTPNYLWNRQPLDAEPTVVIESHEPIEDTDQRNCLLDRFFRYIPLLGAIPDDTERQPVIRQTSLADCGLAALAMLLRDKASVTTSVDKLDSLAAVLIDPRTRRHRREGYSVSELNTLAAAFA